MATPTPVLTAEGLAKTLRMAIRQTTATVTSAPTATGVDFLTTEHITIDGFTNAHATNPGKTIDIAIPTCIQTIEPDANGYLPPGTCNALWDYYPSFSAALAFAILFGLLTLAHLYQGIAYRKKFCWVIVMASFWETMAYLFRTVSTRYQSNTAIYLVFQIFILLSPLWVNAFCYMVLGRMIHFFTPSRQVFGIPAPNLAAAFVTFDFIAFCIQLAGGSMAGPTAPADEQLKAIHIYMGGVGLQQFFIVVFVVFAVKFQLDMRDLRTFSSQQPSWRSGWRPLLFTLYASLTCITIRIIFRLVEFSSGSTGVSNPLLTNESYFYVLEAMPMLFAILSFNVIHPGIALVGPESEMPGFFSTCTGFPRKRKHFKELDESEGEEMLDLTDVDTSGLPYIAESPNYAAPLVYMDSAWTYRLSCPSTLTRTPPSTASGES
ncbi:RTA1 like protein-domain-containing protein [Annulohypoxylon truncatum]|uniref:RTA1 like protein-domain-containing protein n=1 Tax=Annulohypoxylon truncatum TaxID=327061 RepID=UPI0020084836|nr:RTA1 like protein-domain-containing protein [Annulohypoxylon truncatum]KAI1208639.1 RTA1 like protein-domain-containing protein [Annulohypoxylon truncatum]